MTGALAQVALPATRYAQRASQRGSGLRTGIGIPSAAGFLAVAMAVSVAWVGDVPVTRGEACVFRHGPRRMNPDRGQHRRTSRPQPLRQWLHDGDVPRPAPLFEHPGHTPVTPCPANAVAENQDGPPTTRIEDFPRTADHGVRGKHATAERRRVSGARVRIQPPRSDVTEDARFL